MIMEELILEQQMRALERVDATRVAFIDAELARRRGGLRRTLASTLVRLGVGLDGDAGERVVMRRRPAGRAGGSWS